MTNKGKKVMGEIANLFRSSFCVKNEESGLRERYDVFVSIAGIFNPIDAYKRRKRDLEEDDIEKHLISCENTLDEAIDCKRIYLATAAKDAYQNANKMFGSYVVKHNFDDSERIPECDNLILRYMAGHELAKVAAKSLSGKDLGKGADPVESLDDLFDLSNDYVIIQGKLNAHYVSLASQGKLADGFEVINYVVDRR
jgi:hypothetical protein